MMRTGYHVVVIVILTVLTQLGGLAWLVSRLFRRRTLAFLTLYAALSIGALWVAPLFGRVPLSCTSDGPLQMRSTLYCILNRQYVVPELQDVLEKLAQDVDAEFPDTVTLVLDANFPFLSGFPLLPHLSHHDGRKVDLAFYYRDDTAYLPGKTRSPLGYFAFEQGPTDCPPRYLTLRWNMSWLQSLWPDYLLDVPRTRFALQSLANEPRVGKIFVEPHLKTLLIPDSDKVRFQGCRAARHDDHIHLQL